MKVFITGAAGYVGHAVARAFRRAGHDVHGLVRSAARRSDLARGEIHVLVGDLTRPESYREAAEEADVLVHAAADMQVGPPADRTAVQTLLEAARRGPQPKALLYTSGVWVHGDTAERTIDESAPRVAARLVAWRPAHEDLVLGAGHVRGLVLRPGCLYGGRGGLTGSWFEGAREGVLRLVGEGRNHWAMVHADDVGEAYVRAAESGLGGEAFILAEPPGASVRECAEAAAHASGHTVTMEAVALDEARKTMGDFADCLAIDQHVSSAKAEARLGWRPRHAGFVADAPAYYAAWDAWREASRA
jgi:nucleoside-diphosphate-sugar epimerase